jgi:SAM-dependent methyltransferase
MPDSGPTSAPHTAPAAQPAPRLGVAGKVRREVKRVLIRLGWMHPYQPEFFAGQRDDSTQSAAVVVPMLIELARPRSVVDVGCGTGTWLARFIHSGVTDALGLDGDYARAGGLKVPDAHFRAADLTRPINLGRRFDLAVSLEVAEHLPLQAADGFVAALTGLSDVVAFSAAAPAQGGTGHLHEDWVSGWAARFARQGYEPLDLVRPRVWDDPRVSWWYRQNLVIYANAAGKARLDPTWLAGPRLAGLDVVHPEMAKRLARKAGLKPAGLAE